MFMLPLVTASYKLTINYAKISQIVYNNTNTNEKNLV